MNKKATWHGLSAKKPLTPDESRRALQAWGALYRRELMLPVVERTDPRPLKALSDEELFSIPSPAVTETIRDMVAEAAELGREWTEKGE